MRHHRFAFYSFAVALLLGLAAYALLGQARHAEAAPSADLQSLTVSINGEVLPMTPAFDPGVVNYFVVPELKYSQNKVSVTASVYDTNSLIYVNSALVTNNDSYSVALNEQQNDIYVRVLALNGSQKTYHISLYRNIASTENRLASVSLLSYYLDRTFDRNLFEYTVLLNENTDYFSMSFMPLQEGATMSSLGMKLIPNNYYGNSAKLKPGSTKFEITVTSESGSTQAYTFTFVKPAPFADPPGKPSVLGTFSLSPVSYPATRLTGQTDGKPSVYEVISSQQQLLPQISASGRDAVVIDAVPPKGTVDLLQVGVSGEVLKAVSDADKPLLVSSQPVSFELLPRSFPNVAAAQRLRISVEQYSLTADIRSRLPAGVKPMSALLEWRADSMNVTSWGSISGTTQAAPAQAVKMTVQPDMGLPRERSKLTVFLYNASTQQWSKADTRLNADDSVSFSFNGSGMFMLAEYAPGFTDTVGHWAENDIAVMAGKGLINGVTGNRFDPEARVTRAEFAAMLARALRLQNLGEELPYTDVPGGVWYESSLRLVRQAGIISGVTDTSFAPQASITREQMAVMVMKAYSYGSGYRLEELVAPKSLKYADQAAFSSWSAKSIYLAAAIDVMQGGSSGEFQPSGLATRAQAVSVLKRLLDRLKL